MTFGKKMNKPKMGVAWHTNLVESMLVTDIGCLGSSVNYLLGIANMIEKQMEVQVTQSILHPLSDSRIDWTSPNRGEEGLIARIQKHQSGKKKVDENARVKEASVR